jgi:hypothetical protein
MRAKLFNEFLNEEEELQWFKGPSEERIRKNLEGKSLGEKFMLADKNNIKWLIDECIENGLLNILDKEQKFDLAIKYNYPDILNRYINNISPKYSVYESPIAVAASRGNLEVLKILLKDGRFDPTKNCNYAIKYAKTDEIRNELLKDPRVPKFEFNKYPGGYKIYAVLKFIDKNHPRRMDISKFAYELSYGKGTYDKKCNAGFWASYFRKATNYGWSPKPDGILTKLTYVENKQYFLNSEGKQYLEKKKAKFKDI